MKRNRRKFLKGATVATAAAAASPVIGKQVEIGSEEKEPVIPAAPPTHQQRVDESGEPDIAAPEYSTEEQAKYFVDDPVSDFRLYGRHYQVLRY